MERSFGRAVAIPSMGGSCELLAGLNGSHLLWVVFVRSHANWGAGLKVRQLARLSIARYFCVLIDGVFMTLTFVTSGCQFVAGNTDDFVILGLATVSFITISSNWVIELQT